MRWAKGVRLHTNAAGLTPIMPMRYWSDGKYLITCTTDRALIVAEPRNSAA